MTDYTATDAWARGVAAAEAALAMAPPPKDTVTMHLAAGEYELCTRCHWARPGRCTCTPQETP